MTSERSVISVMRERTSNDAIVFRTLAVVDFLGGPAVQVYYRGQRADHMGTLQPCRPGWKKVPITWNISAQVETEVNSGRNLLVAFVVLAICTFPCLSINFSARTEIFSCDYIGFFSPVNQAEIFCPGSSKRAEPFFMYTFCCSLPENILSFTPTSNSLTQKFIHFIQSTITSVDTQPFASKDIL